MGSEPTLGESELTAEESTKVAETIVGGGNTNPSAFNLLYTSGTYTRLKFPSNADAHVCTF